MFECEISNLRRYLVALVSAPRIDFDGNLRASLPSQPGIYRITHRDFPETTIRAGRTKTAKQGLKQRVYKNHFQGDQPGNLGAQLVRRGECADLSAAKDHMRANFQVQVLVIEDSITRARAEYFMLSVLAPKYWDYDQKN